MNTIQVEIFRLQDRWVLPSVCRLEPMPGLQIYVSAEPVRQFHLTENEDVALLLEQFMSEEIERPLMDSDRINPVPRLLGLQSEQALETIAYRWRISFLERNARKFKVSMFDPAKPGTESATVYSHTKPIIKHILDFEYKFPPWDIYEPIPFGPKSQWLAVKTNEPEAVADFLFKKPTRTCAWLDADFVIRELGEAFITPTVGSWTLIRGALPELSGDKRDQKALGLLGGLSKRFGEAQMFGTHRVVDYHMWMRARSGHIERAFAYDGAASEVLTSVGAVSDQEMKYGIPHGEIQKREGGEVDLSEESVFEMASSWSVDPTKLGGTGLGRGYGRCGTIKVPGLFARLLGRR